MTDLAGESNAHQCGSSRPYRLALTTFVSIAPEGAIFLASNENRYFGIDRRQANALETLVDGWPTSVDARERAQASEAISFAESLCAKGVLVRAPSEGRCACPPDLPPARDQLIHWDEMSRENLRARHWPQLIRSRAKAHFELAVLPLNTIILRTQARRKRSPQDALDNPAARELVSIYYHARIWAFRRRRRCLLDSLTLLEFLNSYGIRPYLIFGVKFRPFAAHAWLQHRDLVLNGTPAFVREYQPILVA